MIESPELTKPTEQKLKPGMSIEKEIGGETLKLKPIPYGRLKELLKVVFTAIDQFSHMDNQSIFLQFPIIFEENLPKIMPLMFSKKEHPFLTPEWVDDNMSIVDMREIVEKMIVINGLQDFLGQKGQELTKTNPAQAKKQEEPTQVS